MAALGVAIVNLTELASLILIRRRKWAPQLTDRNLWQDTHP
jgi:hypothetical protein